MYGNQGIRAYRETDISSMGEEKMIVLLYEKMIEHLQAAEDAARDKKRPEMTRRLNLAQRIVVELRNALDHTVGGDIARNLNSLYDFIFQEILSMILDQDSRHAAGCQRVLEPLLAAWRQIPPGTADRMRRPPAVPAGAESAKSVAEPVLSGSNRGLYQAVPTLDGDRSVDASRLVSVSA
jgi:flagellar secretion chaperone FliS